MRLSSLEKRWTVSVFEALLAPEAGGLPPFGPMDLDGFWTALETRTASTFGPGFRAMLHALMWVPLADPRFRRPFFALGRPEREQVLVGLAASPRYVSRQLVATFKILACFAWFEDPTARARVRELA